MEVEWKWKLYGNGRLMEVEVNEKLQWMALLGHHTNSSDVDFHSNSSNFHSNSSDQLCCCSVLLHTMAEKGQPLFTSSFHSGLPTSTLTLPTSTLTLPTSTLVLPTSTLNSSDFHSNSSDQLRCCSMLLQINFVFTQWVALISNWTTLLSLLCCLEALDPSKTQSV